MVNINPGEVAMYRQRLQHAASMGHLNPEQYTTRLAWLQQATTTEQMQALVADLPPLPPGPIAPTRPLAPVPSPHPLPGYGPVYPPYPQPPPKSRVLPVLLGVLGGALLVGLIWGGYWLLTSKNTPVAASPTPATSSPAESASPLPTLTARTELATPPDGSGDVDAASSYALTANQVRDAMVELMDQSGATVLTTAWFYVQNDDVTASDHGAYHGEVIFYPPDGMGDIQFWQITTDLQAVLYHQEVANETSSLTSSDLASIDVDGVIAASANYGFGLSLTSVSLTGEDLTVTFSDLPGGEALCSVVWDPTGSYVIETIGY